MVKQRMNVADVACEVACLKKRIIGMRVANIYDLSPKVDASCNLTCAATVFSTCVVSSSIVSVLASNIVFPTVIQEGNALKRSSHTYGYRASKARHLGQCLLWDGPDK